jgi:hypothetical protein
MRTWRQLEQMLCEAFEAEGFRISKVGDTIAYHRDDESASVNLTWLTHEILVYLQVET